MPAEAAAPAVLPVFFADMAGAAELLVAGTADVVVAGVTDVTVVPRLVGWDGVGADGAVYTYG